ncbi:hypothetical protein [Streptomyces celluloflavus]|uniref:hypothetical protein n=1 Tax=Streptomyces celluloflavus TaxID=58344 RepID=UPI0036BA75D6
MRAALGAIPSRDSKFSTSHVPQLLPLAWYHQFFQAFAAQLAVPSCDNTRYVRRAAALKLVEMVSGGTVSRSAPLLDMPVGIAQSTVRQLRHRCPGTAWTHFQEAG